MRRIVEAAHPLCITAFGWAGRGQMGPGSDSDLMVVMSGGTVPPHAAEARYSLSDTAMGPEECRSALATARRVVEWVERQIPPT